MQFYESVQTFYETEHSLTDLLEGDSKKVFVKEHVKAMRKCIQMWYVVLKWYSDICKKLC